MKNTMNHFDKAGNAVMVDVTEKEVTVRTASAAGSIHVNEDIMNAVLGKSVKKGDVLAIAQVAGIMAAKQTWSLIPMCHPIGIRNCTITFETDQDKMEIRAISTVKIDDKTGVEMEALTAVSVALLTIYDMCKGIDKHMEIRDIHLISKTGGKSGEFQYD